MIQGRHAGAGRKETGRQARRQAAGRRAGYSYEYSYSIEADLGYIVRYVQSRAEGARSGDPTILIRD